MKNYSTMKIKPTHDDFKTNNIAVTLNTASCKVLLGKYQFLLCFCLVAKIQFLELSFCTLL